MFLFFFLSKHVSFIFELDPEGLLYGHAQSLRAVNECIEAVVGGLEVVSASALRRLLVDHDPLLEP